MNTQSTFDQLNLLEPLRRALAERNYATPSPIQARTIPQLLGGHDMVGLAQTGTGKTAAFALPILQRLSLSTEPRLARHPRALILTPTRELAVQVGDSFAAYGKYLRLRHTTIFGGVGQGAQEHALRNGIDILVATPGRLLDLEGQGIVRLDRVEIFVLDEADRMLDMGFAPDVNRILAKLPQRRQSLLFSATMPPVIQEIAARLLRDPIQVTVAPVSAPAERIEQRVCHVDRANKAKLLVHVLRSNPRGLALVFARTKHGANKTAELLEDCGIPTEVIHGNKSQNARQGALERFRAGKARVLVATDIAARGIDVKGISLVINFDIPNESETYVHRIGRTARAGAEGMAVAFCEPEERSWFRDIQRLIRREIPILEDHPYATAVPLHVVPPPPPIGGGGRRQPRPTRHGDNARQRTHHPASPKARRPQGKRRWSAAR